MGGGIVEGMGVDVTSFEDCANDLARYFTALWGDAFFCFLTQLCRIDDLLGVISVEIAGDDVGADVEEGGDIENRRKFS